MDNPDIWWLLAGCAAGGVVGAVYAGGRGSPNMGAQIVGVLCAIFLGFRLFNQLPVTWLQFIAPVGFALANGHLVKWKVEEVKREDEREKIDERIRKGF